MVCVSPIRVFCLVVCLITFSKAEDTLRSQPWDTCYNRCLQDIYGNLRLSNEKMNCMILCTQEMQLTVLHDIALKLETQISQTKISHKKLEKIGDNTAWCS